MQEKLTTLPAALAGVATKVGDSALVVDSVGQWAHDVNRHRDS